MNGSVTWPELFLVLENAEVAARNEAKSAFKDATASREDLWRVVDGAAVEVARKVVAPKTLTPAELRLVVDAAEVANRAAE